MISTLGRIKVKLEQEDWVKLFRESACFDSCCTAVPNCSLPQEKRKRSEESRNIDFIKHLIITLLPYRKVRLITLVPECYSFKGTRQNLPFLLNQGGADKIKNKLFQWLEVLYE